MVVLVISIRLIGREDWLSIGAMIASQKLINVYLSQIHKVILSKP